MCRGEGPTVNMYALSLRVCLLATNMRTVLTVSYLQCRSSPEVEHSNGALFEGGVLMHPSASSS